MTPQAWTLTRQAVFVQWLRSSFIVTCVAWSFAAHAAGFETPCGPAPVGGEVGEAALAYAALAEVVRQVEPTLPRVRRLAGEVEADDVGAEALRYLQERGLVDRSVEASALDDEGWQTMLDSIMRRYAVPTIAARGWDSEAALAADVEALVERLLAVIRPVVLLAWDPANEDRIAFVGLVLNWSPYPRLVVMRPPDGWSMRDGARALATRITLCGEPVRDWVSAPAPVARALFLRHTEDAPMYLVGSDPERDGWPYRVPAGEEIAVFAFEHPEVADVERFSAVFATEPLGPLQIARLVPQVRTNLSPVGLLRAMQTPPQRD